MENQVTEKIPAGESRVARSDRKSRKSSQGGDRLMGLMKLAIYLMILLIFVAGGAVLFSWAKKQNDPPKSYYDLQLLKWRGMVEKDPTNAISHVNLGYVYYKQGNARAAAGEFNEALQYDAKNPMAYYYLGMIAKEGDNTDQALKDLKKSFDLANGTNKLLPGMALGEVYENQKRYEMAAKYYEAAVNVDSMFWNANYGLARVYEQMGKKSEALAQYKAAARFNPENGRLKAAIKRLSNKK